jgi:hypothetical protein
MRLGLAPVEGPSSLQRLVYARHSYPLAQEKNRSAYFTGMLMTNPPITSLILKSRLGLSGWAL